MIKEKKKNKQTNKPEEDIHCRHSRWGSSTFATCPSSPSPSPSTRARQKKNIQKLKLFERGFN